MIHWASSSVTIGTICLLLGASCALAQERHVLKVDGQARTMAFSPDGKLLAARVDRRSIPGAPAHSIVLFSVPQRVTLRTIELEIPPSIKSFAFSPDGRSFVAADTDRIRLWDTSDWHEGRPVPTTGGAQTLCFSPDSKRLYYACYRAAHNDTTGNVRIWDLDASAEVEVLDLKKLSIRCVALSADGTQLVHTVSGRGKNGGVHLRNSETFELKSRLPISLVDQSDAPWVAIAPQGNLVAVSTSRLLAVWEPRTNRLVQLATFGPSANFPHNETCLAFSPSGLQIAASASGRNTDVVFWDVRTRTADRVLRHPNGFHLGDVAFHQLVCIWLPRFSRIPGRRCTSGTWMFQSRRAACPDDVVMLQLRRHKMAEVPLAEDDEVVQAFLTEGLDEPLDEGDGVGRPEGRLQHPQFLGGGQLGVECGAELGVPVVHNGVSSQAFLASVFHKGQAFDELHLVRRGSVAGIGGFQARITRCGGGREERAGGKWRAGAVLAEARRWASA
jgi:sugar lactone lactonase YvrE